MKKECVALQDKLTILLSSCAYPNHLPENAMKAYQRGCQVLDRVRAALDQQPTPQEELVLL